MDGPGTLLGLCDQSEYFHQSPKERADFKGQFGHEGEICSSRERKSCKVWIARRNSEGNQQKGAEKEATEGFFLKVQNKY